MNSLVGTGELFALAWRRDRILVPVSVLGLVLLAVGSAQATLDLYPTDDAAATGLAGILTNPAVIALYGPLPSQSADALAVFKTVMMGAFFVSVLALVVVRRHTRTEEEEGRLELVGAAAVGRWAPLAAAVVLATASVLAASGLAAGGLAALGLDPMGSLAFGVAWATAGLAMVGVAAVAVQVASTTHGAGGLCFGVLGASYVLRAVGDSGSGSAHALGWLSPLGWVGRVEAYGANRLWVLLLGIAVWLVGTGLALVLLQRRDLGAGLIPQRPGPARAGALLSTPTGLVTRLATGTLIGWTVGLVVGGVVIGSLLGSVGELTANSAVSDMLEKLGGSAGTVEDIFLATETAFVSAAVAGAGIALVLRLVAAERSGLGESVLTTPTPRTRWYAAHVGVAIALTTVLMAVLGVTVGLVGPLASDAAPSLGATL
ncbi:MAG: polyketide antibiotic transporter, partial [Ornithinibacter sp.]